MILEEGWWGGGGDTCIEKKVMMKNIRLTSVSSLFPHKVPQSSALEEDFADLGFLTIPGTSLGAAGVRRILHLI